MKFVDCNTDQAEIRRVTDVLGDGAPSFLADAETIKLEKLSSVAFADPAARLWPLHDKRAAWLSLASYARQSALEAHPDAEAVEDRIMAACRMHGITDQEKAAALEASFAAEEETRPADVLSIEVAGRQFNVPVEDGGSELSKIACWMYGNAAAIGFEGRSAGARTILEAGEALGADLGETRALLEKSAGLAQYTDESLKRGLRGRLMRLGATAESEELRHDKLSSLALPFDDACRLLERLDKEASADAAYGKDDAGGIDLPEEALTEQPAAEAAQETDEEIVPGLTTGGVRRKASDIAAALGLGDTDAEQVVESVKGMSPEKLQAVRAIVG